MHAIRGIEAGGADHTGATTIVSRTAANPTSTATAIDDDDDRDDDDDESDDDADELMCVAYRNVSLEQVLQHYSFRVGFATSHDNDNDDDHDHDNDDRDDDREAKRKQSKSKAIPKAQAKAKLHDAHPC